MSNTVVYMCYDVVKPHMFATIYSVKSWCARHGYILKIIPPEKYQGISKTFNKYNAIDHFRESDYEYMVWMDTDVIVKIDTPCIIDSFPGISFAASVLNKTGMKSHNKEYQQYIDFVNLINKPGNKINYKKMLDGYFNTGVMLISKNIINSLYSNDENITSVYTRLCRRYEWTNPPVELMREEFLTNYITQVNNIPVLNLPKKWHSSIGHLDDYISPEIGQTDDDYILHFDVDDKDSAIWSYMCSDG